MILFYHGRQARPKIVVPNGMDGSMRIQVLAALSVWLIATQTNAADTATTQPMGKIVWSVTTDKDIQTKEKVAFFFKSIDGKHHDYMSYWHDQLFSKDRTDFRDDTTKGGVEILPVPAGDWKFYSYSFDTMNGVMAPNVGITFFPKNDFSIPFRVEPGETVYIGSYGVTYVTGRNIFGVSISVGAYFKVSDQQVRDLAIAKQKDSSIQDFTNKMPDIATLNLPYFQPAASAELNKTPGQPN